MIHLFKPERSTSWYFWYRDPVTGKQRQFSCFTTSKAEAERYAVRKLQELLSTPSAPTPPHPVRSHPAATVASSPPPGKHQRISEFCNDYLSILKETLTAKTLSTIQDSFNQLKKRLGDIFLHELTSE